MDSLVPITEAKAKLNDVVRQSEHEPVYLTRHGRPVAVILDTSVYAALFDVLEDLQDRLSLYESLHAEPDMRVPLERALAELGVDPDAAKREGTGGTLLSNGWIVVQAELPEGDEWAVVPADADTPVSTHATKAEAVEAARRHAIVRGVRSGERRTRDVYRSLTEHARRPGASPDG